MDRPDAVRLPIMLILLLAACMLGLIVHIYAESLNTSGDSYSSVDSAEHADDCFVLFSLLFPLHWGILACNPLEAPLRQLIVCQPPLLPPPNS
jgi:hypothetical protein